MLLWVGNPEVNSRGFRASREVAVKMSVRVQSLRSLPGPKDLPPVGAHSHACYVSADSWQEAYIPCHVSPDTFKPAHDCETLIPLQVSDFPSATTWRKHFTFEGLTVIR